MEYSRRAPLFLLMLSSAVLVTLIRFFHAIDPTYDGGIQLQAAHNLLSGRGLSVFSQVLSDLGAGKSLVTLTYFPAGYSLCAAALLGLGLSVATTVKVLAATATLLGWWGWGRVARAFLIDVRARGAQWKWAAVAVATLTPLFFTPPWGGTDIFLWAIVPWVIAAIVDAARDGTSYRWRLDWLAGALCGIAVFMRYVSLFLILYAAVLILWQSGLRLRMLMRRWAVFALGVLPALLVQGYILYVLAESVGTPGGLLAEERRFLPRLWVGIQYLHTANTFWNFWVPGTITSRIFPGGTRALAWQLGVTALAFVSWVTALQFYRRHAGTSGPDLRTAALGLFAAVPLTLLGCTMVSSSIFVAEPRYYWPVVPLSAFAAYFIASSVDVPADRLAIRLLKRSSTLYVAAYVAMSLVYAVSLVLPARISESPRSRLVATELWPWPSMAVTYEFHAARQLVMQRLKEHPDTLLLTSRAGEFFWDPAVDRSRLFDLNCGSLPDKPTYITGPARILIHSFDDGQPQELWYYAANRKHERATCFDRLPAAVMVRQFPKEGFKVLEAHVANGQRIALIP